MEPNGSPYFVERRECPACRSSQSRLIFQCGYASAPIKDYLERYYAPTGGIDPRYLEGAQYVLLECLTCHLVYQRDVPCDQLMAILYEQWLDLNKVLAQYVGRDNTFQASLHFQEMQMVIATLRKVPDQLECLDFGMGAGHWCRIAQILGCSVHGLEVSSSRIAYAEAYGVPVITHEQLPDYRFDYINAEQVFEHLPEPLETLRYLKQFLKPGGMIKIAVPDGGDIHHRLRRGNWQAAKGARDSLHPVTPMEHINCFPHGALVNMAAKAGMQPVYVPMRVQYAYSTNWFSLERTVKNLLRPLYYNILHRGTRLFFRDARGTE